MVQIEYYDPNQGRMTVMTNRYVRQLQRYYRRHGAVAALSLLEASRGIVGQLAKHVLNEAIAAGKRKITDFWTQSKQPRVGDDTESSYDRPPEESKQNMSDKSKTTYLPSSTLPGRFVVHSAGRKRKRGKKSLKARVRALEVDAPKDGVRVCRYTRLIKLAKSSNMPRGDTFLSFFPLIDRAKIVTELTNLFGTNHTTDTKNTLIKNVFATLKVTNSTTGPIEFNYQAYIAACDTSKNPAEMIMEEFEGNSNLLTPPSNNAVPATPTNAWMPPSYTLTSDYRNGVIQWSSNDVKKDWKPCGFKSVMLGAGDTLKIKVPIAKSFTWDATAVNDMNETFLKDLDTYIVVHPKAELAHSTANTARTCYGFATLDMELYYGFSFKVMSNGGIHSRWYEVIESIAAAPTDPQRATDEDLNMAPILG